MTAQDLKNSILQLAVQGKLVPQDPSNEPASELLKRIQVFRTDAIKNGTLSIDKKHTADPITEDDIPYDLPPSWAWVRFADIVTFSSGKTPARQDTESWSNGVCPWVSIADMVADGVIFETKEKVSEKAISESFSGKISPVGTMIMSFKLTIGKMSILGIDAVHNEAIISIFPTVEHKDEDTIKAYLFKILPLVAVTGESKNAVKGKTLNATSISNLMIPLPPLAEQRRIVEKIEELLPLVEEYGEAENRLSELNTEFPDKLHKSILQQAVQGKLTERDPSDEPASELLKRIRAEKAKLIAEGKIKKEKPLPPITEEEKPFDIPDTWEWVRLSEICNISDGTHQTPKYVDIGVPFISAQNVKPYRFIPEFHRDVSREDYLEYNKVVAPAKGDILMTRVGAGIGEAAIIDQDFEFSIYVSLTLIKRYGNELNMEYLLHVLNSPLGRKLASRKTLGKGASQGNLNLIFIREFILPIPPLAEQNRIVARANELLAVCEGLK